MRMIERRHRVGFALEAGAEPRLGDFDRDCAVESRVQGLVDRAHAARADHSLNPVWA